MKIQVFLTGLFVSAGIVSAAPIKEATFPEISRYYDGVVDSLLSPDNPFLDRYKPLAFDICWSKRNLSQEQIQERGLRKLPFHYYPSVAFVCAQFDFQVVDSTPPKLIQMSNCLLSRYLLMNSISYVTVLLISRWYRLHSWP